MADTIVGTEFDDRYINARPQEDSSSINYDGLGGNDVINADFDIFRTPDFSFAGFYDDTVTGGEGDDLVYGDSGSIQLVAVVGGGADGGLTFDLGDDVITGDEGEDVLFGGGGGAFLAAEDSTVGGPYLLAVENGNDTIDGGDGDDIVVGDFQTVTVRSAGAYAGETFADDAENRFGGGNDLLSGGTGDDRILGEGESLRAETDSSNVFLEFENAPMEPGSISTSTIIAGDDTIDGGDGNDWIVGDATTLRAEGDFKELGREGSGTSTHLIDAGDDEITGGTGDDIIYGDGETGEAINLNDTSVQIFGTGNTDTSSVLGGNDTIDGGADDDLIVGDFATARAEVFNDDDSINLVSGGNDVLNGGDGEDEIYGDFITVIEDAGTGGASASVTFGDDTINGGAGNDDMWGGGGADSFVFEVNSGKDTIHDFERGVDVLDLTALDLSFGDLRIKTNKKGTKVDLDGKGKPGDEVFLDGVMEIDASDFLF